MSYVSLFSTFPETLSRRLFVSCPVEGAAPSVEIRWQSSESPGGDHRLILAAAPADSAATRWPSARAARPCWTVGRSVAVGRSAGAPLMERLAVTVREFHWGVGYSGRQGEGLV